MLKVEETNNLNHHEQVWLCQACERAPAEFLCKADSASLCASCDSDIHSANPLARRHHRVPISSMLCGPSDHGLIMTEPEDIDGEDEAASWLLLNPGKNGGLFGGEVDEYLDLDDYNSSQSSQFNDQCNYQQQDCHVSDSVVSIQYGKGKENRVQELFYQLGLDYESSTIGYNYPSSMSHSVSISSMEVGVVPESTSEASISISGIAVKTPTQLTPMDREARVLRYREKKKNRKFEKTIRYASRKAYAEVRPRIKGRFAKRTTDVEVEVDQMLSTYGIVPSFL